MRALLCLCLAATLAGIAGCGARDPFIVYEPPPGAEPFEVVEDGVLRERGWTIPGAGDERLRDGPYVRFHPDGSRAEEGLYVSGRRDGEWYLWDDDGALVAKRIYRDGELVREIHPAPTRVYRYRSYGYYDPWYHDPWYPRTRLHLHFGLGWRRYHHCH